MGQEIPGEVGRVFGIHADVKKNNGDIVDVPVIPAVVEVKQGDVARFIHQEIATVRILMDQSVSTYFPPPLKWGWRQKRSRI